MNKEQGFSLIELMIVVAIIGVIGAIAMPSYESYMLKSKRADAKVALSKVADKQERYYLQNNIYAPDTATLGMASNLSDEGYYAITITNADASGFTLTATAVATGPQVQDTTTGAGNCTQMTLDSTGLKTAPLALDPLGDDNGGAIIIPDCW